MHGLPVHLESRKKFAATLLLALRHYFAPVLVGILPILNRTALWTGSWNRSGSPIQLIRSRYAYLASQRPKLDIFLLILSGEVNSGKVVVGGDPLFGEAETSGRDLNGIALALSEALEAVVAKCRCCRGSSHAVRIR